MIGHFILGYLNNLPIYLGKCHGRFFFFLFDVSMDIHHGKFTLGNVGHTRFVSFPR